MKRNVLPLSLVMMLGAGAVSAATLQEKMDRTFDVTPATRLVLDNTNGHVSLRSWDRSQVRIEAIKKTESRSDDTAKSLMSNLKIEISQSASALTVKTKYPQTSDSILHWIAGESGESQVEYTITVPRKLNISIETVNGGIDATGLSGSMHFETVNGGVKVADAAGALDIETTNGSIRAELLSAAAGQPMSFETTNGGVSLELPSDLHANVDLDTMNGSVSTDLPLVVHSKDRTSLSGTLNGGGAKLVVRTTNGSIKLTPSVR